MLIVMMITMDDDDGAVYGDHVVDSGDSHGRSSWPLQVWF